MTLKQFIKENRQELDKAIRSIFDYPNCKLNDSDRELWILNDESLYQWARSEGIKI